MYFYPRLFAGASVPNDGKELTEFTRSKEVNAGADLKLVNWGTKGTETSKYAKVVPNDIIQTFRNYINAIVAHQVHKRMKRDALLILLDEFDVIKIKNGLGSIIKSLSSTDVKFGICGIGHDLTDLVEDHASIERLLEQGAIHVEPMSVGESREILDRAEHLFKGKIKFEDSVKKKISDAGQGYPYFVQMIGKSCVSKANEYGKTTIDETVYNSIIVDIKNGTAFPTLESAYQRAIGHSEDRQILLHLLAEQPIEKTQFNEDVGRVFLKQTRKEASDFNIEYVDQLLPRLLDKKFGPVLTRVQEGPGIYEFVNPVFKLYVMLRNI